MCFGVGFLAFGSGFVFGRRVCLKNRWKGKVRNKVGEEVGLDRGRN